MYLPTKMCPSRPYTDNFTRWIHGRLGRRVQRVIPVYTSHKTELLSLSGEQNMDNTQHLLTAALTNIT
ncbi:hypothetical protein NP493_590g00007 [Ridgeia piscesae]|uniref:Uncharacterized protein n=1 Tax=Ridgeia piscesae TaxID=27915 RepID=A0AAD9KU91_RIDPI|nr:hypothetical protein NP493_590g00007 [Ridgeia piscesae]